MPAITADQLPEVILGYLERRTSEDPASAADLFTEDATVRDEGRTYTGREAIRSWILDGLTTYRYTVTFLSAEAGDGRYTVRNHLEGDFPGGTVDLAYGFRLADGEIAIRELTFG